MIWDEEQPRKPKTFELGADLAKLSVDELQEYVALLEAERKRVEAMVASKKSSLDAADSIFKS